MAAFFCWMYIKKPVFLSTPSDQKSIEALPAIQEGRPMELKDELSTPTAESVGRIDPAIANLPGDSVTESLLGSPMNDGLGSGLKPLLVRREGSPLFRPLGRDTLPQLTEDSPVGRERVSTRGPGQIQNANDEAGEEVEVENLVPLGEGGRPVDSDDYQVHASFMAEFAAAEGSNRDEDRRP